MFPCMYEQSCPGVDHVHHPTGGGCMQPMPWQGLETSWRRGCRRWGGSSTSIMARIGDKLEEGLQEVGR